MSDSSDDMEFYSGLIESDEDMAYEAMLVALQNIASVTRKHFEDRPDYWAEKIINTAIEALRKAGEL